MNIMDPEDSDKITDPLVPGIPHNIKFHEKTPRHDIYLWQVSGIKDVYDCNEDEAQVYSLTAFEFMKWRKAVLWFSVVSIVAQLILAIIAIVGGLKVDSSGTFGFGLETLMDIITTVVVIWRYTGTDGLLHSEAKEKKSVVVLAILMILFSIGIATKGIYNLTHEFLPFKELELMIISLVAIAVFTVIACGKFVLASKIRSKAVYIDAISETTMLGRNIVVLNCICTVFDISMAVALLISLLVYHFTKLWYLDDIVALLIALAMVAYASRTLYMELYKNKDIR